MYDLDRVQLKKEIRKIDIEMRKRQSQLYRAFVGLCQKITVSAN
jgi:hypothetical protein